jgi:hypothetical protein
MSRNANGSFGTGNRAGRRFEKGASGNPGGLPAYVREVRLLAGQHSVAAIERLAKLIDHREPRVAIAAAVAILDRGGIKPFECFVDLQPSPGWQPTEEELDEIERSLMASKPRP